MANFSRLRKYHPKTFHRLQLQSIQFQIICLLDFLLNLLPLVYLQRLLLYVHNKRLKDVLNDDKEVYKMLPLHLNQKKELL